MKSELFEIGANKYLNMKGKSTRNAYSAAFPPLPRILPPVILTIFPMLIDISHEVLKHNKYQQNCGGEGTLYNF